MANPLSPGIHRYPDMQFDLAHLEGSSVTMAHFVANQPCILMHCPCPRSIGNTRRLHDGFIGAQVVDHTNEAIIERWPTMSQHAIKVRHADPRKFLGGLIHNGPPAFCAARCSSSTW